MYDPPRNFARRNFSVGPSDAVVGQHLAYSFTQQRTDSGAVIQAIELRSGEERWQKPIDAYPTSRPAGRAPLTRLVVGPDADDKESVAYTGLRVTPGSGTQQDRREVIVGLLSAESGTWLGSVRADLPADFAVSDTDVLLAGANQRHLVATVADPGDPPVSLVVDPRTRKVAWTDKGFLALGLDGDIIIGIQFGEGRGSNSNGQLRAVNADTRVPLWTGPGSVPRYGVRVVAPGVVQVLKTEPYDGAHSYLIDTRNGNQLADLGGDHERCLFDQRETLVCENRNALYGLDAATMRELWRLREGNRVRPKLHTAFHGLVYTATREAVFLDARTGRDSITDATVTPDIVIAGFGLVERDHQLHAHSATG